MHITLLIQETYHSLRTKYHSNTISSQHTSVSIVDRIIACIAFFKEQCLVHSSTNDFHYKVETTTKQFRNKVMLPYYTHRVQNTTSQFDVIPYVSSTWLRYHQSDPIMFDLGRKHNELVLSEFNFPNKNQIKSKRLAFHKTQ